jgi:rhodanese-related sulfurtransferase
VFFTGEGQGGGLLMQEFMQFAANNWLLCTAFVVILLALFATEMRSKVGGVTKLSPQKAVAMMNHDNAIVLDIRSKEDYDKGHIIDAIHAHESDLKLESKKLQKYKTKPVVLVCASGQSSLKAGMALHKQGFENVHHLHGGLAAWRNAGLPLTK